MLEHPAAFEARFHLNPLNRSTTTLLDQKDGRILLILQRENWSLAGVTGSRSYNQSVQSCVRTASPWASQTCPPPSRSAPACPESAGCGGLFCSILPASCSLQLLANTIFLFLLIPIWTTRMNGIMQCVALCDWLLSLSVIVSGLIQTRGISPVLHLF